MGSEVTEKEIRESLWTGAYDEHPRGYGFTSAPERSADKDIEFLLAQLSALKEEKEKVERVAATFAVWIVRNKPSHYIDHACRECLPFGESVKEGFRCAVHLAYDFPGVSNEALNPEAVTPQKEKM